MHRIEAVTLNAFAVFSQLPVVDRDKIAKLMSSHEFKAGNYIISPQDRHRSVYFIMSGSVRACAVSESGRQVYYEDLSAGMMFGELAVIDGGSRTSDCVALTDSWIASLSDQQFNLLIDQYPLMARVVLKRLAGMVRYQLQRIYEFTAFGVNQRIRLEVARLAADGVMNGKSVELSKVPTQAELAERICSHREAVARELKKLERSGFITWNRRKHVIHDLPQLVQHATEP